MNIWYVNHYASPRGRGRGERPLLLADALRRRGHAVLIVAARRHHLLFDPGAAPVAGRVAELDGQRFFPVEAPAYRGNGVGRFRNMTAFARGAARLRAAVARGELAAPDVLVYSSPHPFACKRYLSAARRLKAVAILEVRDLWPLSLVELAGLRRWHPLALWSDRILRHAYRRAAAVIGLVPNALAYMQPRGLAPERFHYIPNGVDPRAGAGPSPPLPPAHRELFARLRREGRLVVVYAGGMGPPNALEQVLDLAGVGDGGTRPYHFVLIGDGPSGSELRRRIEREGIDFVSLLPPLPKPVVRTALEAADVCFLGWRRSTLYGYGIGPNKLFDYFLAGKPVLHAVEAANDPVAAAGAGISVPPFSAPDLDRALRALMVMPAQERARMGEAGRSYVLAHHDWEKLAERYAGVCEHALASRA